MSEDPSSDSTKRERERAGAGQVALVSTPAERGSECDGGRRAEFRNRRWRGRRQVQESESVACTRKCHGYAVGGVDGAEALRGCTLRRACASVSKWRASELCRPREKKNFAQKPVKNFRQKAVARNDSRDRRGRKRIGTRKTKNRRAEMDALRRRKTFVRRHSKAVCRVCCATRSALLARRGAPLGRREGAGRHSRLEV